MHSIIKRLFHDTPVSKLRNFCIVAHVDHGKSTLADRLMELTGAKPPSTDHHTPSLDCLPVERSRGITVKTQCVTMPYQGHLLTLMDTPGHVDFGGEVAREVVGCEGAVVVVDASQGIQPQTINNVVKARRVGLKAFVPVVNKIDLETADTERACRAIADILGVDAGSVLRISAKTGRNVPMVLERVISDIPPPNVNTACTDTDCIILDSWYDEYRGVVCLVSVKKGRVTANTTFYLASNKEPITVTQVGYLTPKLQQASVLPAGHIGYVMTGVKTIRAVRIGDHLVSELVNYPVELSVSMPKPTIYAGLFPKHNQDYQQLSKALDKLLLNDAAVSVEKAHSAVLGAGFRLGFLGTLHMDVFRERLHGGFAADTIITAPTVTFMVSWRDGTTTTVTTAQDFPDHKQQSRVLSILEPMCRVTITCQESAMGSVMTLIGEHRGTMLQPDILADHVNIGCRMPLLELIGDFYDRLQSCCSGLCTFNYEHDGHSPSAIVMVKTLINNEAVDMLSFLAHHSTARHHACRLLARLKAALDRHQFGITLQAAINGRVVAREEVAAVRKDVTQKCYGGDGTRKRKLLEQQKEGKARLRQIGKVSIDPEAVCDLMRYR